MLLSNFLTGITSRHDYNHIQLAKRGKHCAEFALYLYKHQPMGAIQNRVLHVYSLIYMDRLMKNKKLATTVHTNNIFIEQN